MREMACQICGFHECMPDGPRKTKSAYNKVLPRGPIDAEMILKLKCHV